MTKRVLITGGTGFLGLHLARKFVKEKYTVTLFDLENLEEKALRKKVRFIKGDIRDQKAIASAMIGQDYVVHAAAALPVLADKKIIFSINIDGTKTVLNSALKHNIKRVVFISSTAIYGVPKHLPEMEDSPLSPIGYYGISKIAGEKLCLSFQKKGLPVNILRPTTFLGTERLGIFELWFEAMHSNKRVFILGSGNNTYQLLAVTDFADAIEKALLCKKSGEIFNIGAAEFGTWREDLGYVIKKIHSKSVITSLPTLPSQLILQLLEILHLSPLAAWHYKVLPVDSYTSIEKAKKILGWKPKKSNKELFLESYLWYKEHRKEVMHTVGNTHRVGWNFKLLNLVAKL